MLGITLLNFTLLIATPGDPVIVRIGLIHCETEECYNLAYNKQALEMGLLDDEMYTIPWFTRYIKFVNGILHGDFGNSWYNTQAGQGIPVADIIKERLVYTLTLNVIATIFSIILATGIGVISATRQNSIWDRTLTIGMLLGWSMPLFWLAKLLMLLSFYMFRFTGVANKDAFKRVKGTIFLNGQFYKFLILPTLSLTLGGLVFMARLIRSQLLEILRQDYIITAKAKGLDNRAVIYKHAFRNGLLPIVAFVGMSLPGLLAGSMMIESVFGWPGLGTIYIESALFRDYPTMLIFNVLYPFLFLIAMLLTDVTYAFIDPRIKY